MHVCLFFGFLIRLRLSPLDVYYARILKWKFDTFRVFRKMYRISHGTGARVLGWARPAQRRHDRGGRRRSRASAARRTAVAAFSSCCLSSCACRVYMARRRREFFLGFSFHIHIFFCELSRYFRIDPEAWGWGASAPSACSRAPKPSLSR